MHAAVWAVLQTGPGSGANIPSSRAERVGGDEGSGVRLAVVSGEDGWRRRLSFSGIQVCVFARESE